MIERGKRNPTHGRGATNAEEKGMSASSAYTVIAAVSLLLVIGIVRVSGRQVDVLRTVADECRESAQTSA